MGNSILPNSGAAPRELKKYLDVNGLRQVLRQSRLHWNLKPNKDCDFYDNKTLFKYTGELHNQAAYQRMEIHTYPDNGAYEGYSGINNDSGIFGIVHNIEKWDEGISEESVKETVNRLQIGSMAKIPSLKGVSLSDENTMVKDSPNRMASMIFDPFDGRAYLFTNDDTIYVNNEDRKKKLPLRTVARIADIPTRITDLKNDLDFVADIDYHHTDNNFTNSNRYVLDNLDDRTFVYPEISKNNAGEYLENYRIGLSGKNTYEESDGQFKANSQDAPAGDRFDNVISSYGINKKFSGVNHTSGYLPGIFRSIEELNKVDLVGQLKTPLTHKDTPGSRRSYNYYHFDGIWSPTWFDRINYKDSYLAQSLRPIDMELTGDDREPKSYTKIYQDMSNPFRMDKLYQWRYNRVSIIYKSSDIGISIEESGREYRIGDILRWTFGDDVIEFQVTKVGLNGQILYGVHINDVERIYEQDPSTHGVGITFSNSTGVGYGAKLSVLCKATIKTNATQIKNNLYAYVDITPSVRSDNTSEWSDTKSPDDQGGKIVVRSTAASPGYTGINSGRGGPAPAPTSSEPSLYEHGGNATAGVHVHLFRYVINTQNPTWVMHEGVQVFTGRWVDQGPLGVERPCDIKALFLSNPDTNNFNNYYKFTMDNLFDSYNRNPDAVITNNKNAVSQAYLHIDENDPTPDLRFTENRINSVTSKYEKVDITNRVVYINAATGVAFMYNAGYKNDPNFGYGNRPPGWFALGGYITR